MFRTTVEKYKTPYNPYLKMVVEILRTGNWLDAKVSGVLKRLGITHVQFNILRILEGAMPEPLAIGEIKNRLLFNQSDMTRLLDRLEKKQLISRSICPNNRRKMDIVISEKGIDLIKEALPKIDKELEGFFKDKVSPKDRDVVINTLINIRA